MLWSDREQACAQEVRFRSRLHEISNLTAALRPTPHFRHLF
jgi:hypothetical protein